MKFVFNELDLRKASADNQKDKGNINNNSRNSGSNLIRQNEDNFLKANRSSQGSNYNGQGQNNSLRQQRFTEIQQIPNDKNNNSEKKLFTFTQAIPSHLSNDQYDFTQNHSLQQNLSHQYDQHKQGQDFIEPIKLIQKQFKPSKSSLGFKDFKNQERTPIFQNYEAGQAKRNEQEGKIGFTSFGQKRSGFQIKNINEQGIAKNQAQEKSFALKEQRKKGFQMTEVYKKKNNIEQDGGAKKILTETKKRDGNNFERGEKVFQQILFTYFKKELGQRIKEAEGIDFVMFKIPPKCLHPKPLNKRKKQDIQQDYYGILQQSKDKYFIDMLDYLMKSSMFSLDQLRRFEQKKLQLSNNAFKSKYVTLSKKKEGILNGTNKLDSKYLGAQNNNYFQGNSVPFGAVIQSQANNSLGANACQNSFNDFASESNSVHGMGWDNTNLSSDIFIVNMMNSFKNNNNNINNNQQGKVSHIGKQVACNEVESEHSSFTASAPICHNSSKESVEDNPLRGASIGRIITDGFRAIKQVWYTKLFGKIDKDI